MRAKGEPSHLRAQVREAKRIAFREPARERAAPVERGRKHVLLMMFV